MTQESFGQLNVSCRCGVDYFFDTRAGSRRPELVHLCVDEIVEHIFRRAPGLRDSSFVIAGSAALALFLGFEGRHREPKDLQIFYDDIDVFYAGPVAGRGYQSDRKIRCEELGVNINLVEFAHGTQAESIIETFDINAIQVGLEVLPALRGRHSAASRRQWLVTLQFLEFLQKPELRVAWHSCKLLSYLRLAIKSYELHAPIASFETRQEAECMKLNGVQLTARQLQKVQDRLPHLFTTKVTLANQYQFKIDGDVLLVEMNHGEAQTEISFADSSVFSRRQSRFEAQRPSVALGEPGAPVASTYGER